MAHAGKISIFFFAILWCINLNHAVRQNVRSKRDVDVGHLRETSFHYTLEILKRFRNENLHLDDLETILIKMGLGEMYHDHHAHGDHSHDHDGHDHDHDGHDHDGHDDHDHDGHDHEGHNHDDHDHDGHNHDDHDHDGHDDHDHEGHNHDDHDHDGHNHDDHDHEGHDHDEHDHEGHDHGAAENITREQCVSTDVLLRDYDLGDASELDATEFLFLCPALVNQLLSGACEAEHHHDHNHGDETEDNRNMGLVWFYLMLAVTIISLCAVWGILCIPKRSKSTYEKVIHFLMAMGAGSMAGDALLHLLPHALMPPHDHSAHGHEGHDHGSHDHGEHGDHGDEHLEALLKGLVALIGLYAFFALERLFSICLSRSASKSKGNSEPKLHGLHSHGEPLEDVKFISASNSNNTAITDLTPCSLEDNGKTHHWPHAHGGDNGFAVDAPTSDNSVGEKKGFCPKLTPLALMIVLGDMFHNLCDGIAMGAAFSASTTIGISTSLAVFCHEFPHEVGDFAILLNSGLNRKWAVGLNGASALTCYLGAVIGMFLGSSVGNAPMWIFAGVAGMFLYIALVDLIPEMTHIYLTPGKSWRVFLSLHAAGLFIGSLFMLILGVYEHDIQTSLA